MRRREPVVVVMMMVATMLGISSVSAQETQPPAPPATQLGSPISYTFPANVPVFPEGIAYHAPTSNFFVGSTTDGTIYRGNVRGSDRSLTPLLPGGQDGRTTAIGMKVAPNGFLWVAGGGTGRIWLYNALTGENLLNIYTGTENTFINDVAVAPDERAAYFTDSVSPFVYRVALDAQGLWQYELWLDLTGTPFVYQQGFNANGIAATPDGRHVIIVQSNTGKLFRISTTSKEVIEIDTAGQRVMMGDGILLSPDGRTLYVLRNALNLLVRMEMSADHSSGRVTGQFTSSAFRYTTTLAQAGNRLLFVNSQFNRRAPGQTPEFPFTVVSAPVPR